MQIGFPSSQILCLPWGANPKRLFTWKPVISHFHSRLRIWKGRLLSMTGRVCMIRIVLNSLPLHYMSIFLMLRGIAHMITSIKWRFLWVRTSDTKKICKVSWNLVVREKIRGGLRVGSLAGKNKALLFKWIWRSKYMRLAKDNIKKYRPIFENTSNFILYCRAHQKIEFETQFLHVF